MFKIGDKVIIVKDLSGYDFYKKTIGMTGVITFINRDNDLVDEGEPIYMYAVEIDKIHNDKLIDIADELDIDIVDYADYNENGDTNVIYYDEREITLYKETPKDKVKKELLMLTI